MKPSLHDVIAFVGLVLFVTGLHFHFGWPIALIVVGLALLAIGVYGELTDDTEKDIQS